MKGEPAELLLFTQLIGYGRLGRGECSAMAVAITRNLVLIDHR